LAAFLPEAAGAFPALGLPADGLLCDRVMLQQMDPQSVKASLMEHQSSSTLPGTQANRGTAGTLNKSMLLTH
jgi:hypothetical protein